MADFPQKARSVTLDAGRDVSGPHFPQPERHEDEALLQHLAELHDRAQSALNDHRHERDEQVRYHEGEIDRAQRVLAACERALEVLQPKQAEVPHVQAAEPWPY